MKTSYKFKICSIQFYLDCYVNVMSYSISFFMNNTINILFEPCKMFNKKELKQRFRKNHKHWTYAFEDEIIKSIFNNKKIVIREFGL